MADPTKLDITSDDAAIFSANTSTPFGSDDSDLDTEDPTGGKIGHGNIRPQSASNRVLKSGAFPDGALYNLTPGARNVP